MNFIEAIKKVRSLPVVIDRIESNDIGSIGTTYRGRVDIGLADAKKLVEDIMAINRESEVQRLQNELVRLNEKYSKADEAYWKLRGKLARLMDEEANSVDVRF